MESHSVNFLAVSYALKGILALVVVAILIAATVYFRHRRRTIWQRFARRHGLTCEQHDTGLSVLGTVNDREVALETLAESSDTGPMGIEEIRMTVRADLKLPTNLKIESAPGLIGDVQRTLTAERITIGNEAADHALLVTDADPDEARQWLTGSRQTALAKLVTMHSDKYMHLDESGLFLQIRNAVSRSRQLDEMLLSLLNAADALQAGSESRRNPSEPTPDLSSADTR